MSRRKTDEVGEISFIIPRPVLIGPEVWLSMPEHLLNKEAKAVLNEDPNMTRETMAKLLQVQPIVKDVQFYFGHDSETDVGIALLSICINENLSQSMAELIARYATARNIPFTEAATGVLRLYYSHKKQFIRYVNEGGGYASKIWSPKEVSIAVMPPSKKRAKRKEGCE